MFALCSRHMLGLQLRKCSCMIHQITSKTVFGDVFLDKRLKPSFAHEPHALMLLRHVSQLQTHSPAHDDMSEQACRRSNSQPASDAQPYA